MELPGLPFVYLAIDKVCEARGGCSASKHWEDVRRGLFPAPDKVGSRSLWRSDVVSAWLLEQARIAEENRQAQAKAGSERAQRLVRARKERLAA